VDVSAVAGALGGLVARAGLAGPAPGVDRIATILDRPVLNRMAERLYRLDELRPPRPSPGAARRANGADAELVASWLDAFREEAFGGHGRFSADVRRWLADPEGRIWLW